MRPSAAPLAALILTLLASSRAQTVTSTATPSLTSSQTVTRSQTSTATPSKTRTPSPTISATLSRSPTQTVTTGLTPTATQTPSQSPAMTPGPPPCSWVQQGCFNDPGPLARAVPFLVGTVATLESCETAAALRGFNTAGVRDGGECRAGFNAPYSTYGYASSCPSLGDASTVQVSICIPTVPCVIKTFFGTLGSVGNSGDGGPGISAKLNNPCYAAYNASSGALYVTDSVNNNVRTYSAVGTTGTAAVLAGSAHGIIFDALTNTMLLTLYSPGQVLRLNGSGGVSIVAGGGALSALTVGVPATSVALNNIPFVAPDSAGGFYFAQQTQRVVSYVNVSGFLSRAVGNGTAGTGGDSGPASLATITSPFCIAMDATGAGYYVCDFGVGAIRYVTLASGTISTVAGVGSPGISGDGGPATLAKITGPVQVVLDPASPGAYFIVDRPANNIRYVGACGLITTVVGSAAGTSGSAGDGGPSALALLNFVEGATYAAWGALAVADRRNAVVRYACVSDVAASLCSYSGTSSLTPSTTASATGSSSALPSPSSTKSQSGSRSQSASLSRTGSGSASPSVSPSASPSGSGTSSGSALGTRSLSPSSSQSLTPSPSSSMSQSRSFTGSSSASSSLSITPTRTSTPSSSQSRSATHSGSATASASQTQSDSESQTRSMSLTVSQSRSQLSTPSQSGSPTAAPSPSGSQSQTVTTSYTRTNTRTPSVTPSQEGTTSNSGSLSATSTSSESVTCTPSSTRTASTTRSGSQSRSQLSTFSQSQTDSASLSASQAFTASQSHTPSVSGSCSSSPSFSATQSQTISTSYTRTQTRTISTTASVTTSGTRSVTASGSAFATPSASQTRSGAASLPPTLSQTFSATTSRSPTPSASQQSSSTSTPSNAGEFVFDNTGALSRRIALSNSGEGMRRLRLSRDLVAAELAADTLLANSLHGVAFRFTERDSSCGPGRYSHASLSLALSLNLTACGAGVTACCVGGATTSVNVSLARGPDAAALIASTFLPVALTAAPAYVTFSLPSPAFDIDTSSIAGGGNLTIAFSSACAGIRWHSTLASDGFLAGQPMGGSGTALAPVVSVDGGSAWVPAAAFRSVRLSAIKVACGASASGTPSSSTSSSRSGSRTPNQTPSRTLSPSATSTASESPSTSSSSSQSPSQSQTWTTSYTRTQTRSQSQSTTRSATSSLHNRTHSQSTIRSATSSQLRTARQSQSQSIAASPSSTQAESPASSTSSSSTTSSGSSSKAQPVTESSSPSRSLTAAPPTTPSTIPLCACDFTSVPSITDTPLPRCCLGFLPPPLPAGEDGGTVSPLAVGLGVGLGALFCCCALACILLLARQHQRAKGQREMAGVGANYVPADGPERAPQTVPEVELAARYDEVPPPFEVVRAAVGLQPPIALERIPAVSRPAGYFAVPAAASSDVAIAASTALRQRAPSRWAILTPRLQSGTLVRSRTGSTNSAAGRCHPSSFSPLAMQPGPEPPQGLPAPRGRSNAIVAPPVMTRLRTASVAIFTPVVAFVTRLRGWTVTTRTTTTPPSAPPEVGGAPDAMRPAHGALAIVELDNDPALPPGQLPEPPTAAPPAPLSVVEAHRDGRSRFIALPSNAAAPHPAAAANTVVAASPVITGCGHAVPPSGGAGPLMMRSPPRAATSGIIADVPAIELLDSGNAQLSAVPGTIGALLDHSNHRSVPRLLLPISLPSQARPGQPARLALPSQSSRPLPATSAAVARPLAGTAAPSAVTQQLLLSHAPAGRMRSSSTALSLLLADYGGPAPPAVRGSVRDGESGFGAASERLVTPGAFIRRSGNHRRRVGGQSHSPPPQAAASAPRAPSMRPVLAAAAGACRWQPADETSSRSAGEVATKAPSSASRHATPTTPAASFEQQRAEIPLQADGDFSVDDASELVEVIAALEAAFDRRSRGVFESAAATDASPVAPSAARSAQATIHAPPRRLHSTVAVSSRRDDAELDEQADPVMVSPSPASLVVRPPTSNFAAASASAPSPALPVTADATATVASDPLAGPLHACLPSLPASQSVTVRGGSSPPLPALPLPPVLRDDDNWGAALDWVLAEGAVPSLLPEPDALGARSPPGGVALHCGQARVAEFAETQRAPRQPTAVISASAASDVLETGSVALGNSQIAPMPVIEEGSSPAHAVARAGPSAVAGTTAATAARGITTATEVEDDLLESLFFTPSRNSL